MLDLQWRLSSRLGPSRNRRGRRRRVTNIEGVRTAMHHVDVFWCPADIRVVHGTNILPHTCRLIDLISWFSLHDVLHIRSHEALLELSLDIVIARSQDIRPMGRLIWLPPA